MRDTLYEGGQVAQCEFMVINLGPKTVTQSAVYIFGSMFFNLFFAQFSYTNSFLSNENDQSISQVLIHPKNVNLHGVSIT